MYVEKALRSDHKGTYILDTIEAILSVNFPTISMSLVGVPCF